MMSKADESAKHEVDVLMRLAFGHEARGAWSEAIEAWSRASARMPGFLPTELGLAQSQVRAGRAADAIPLLERMSGRAPDSPAVWLALAVARSMLGRHVDAVESAMRARSLAPTAAVVELGLGDVLRAAGRFDDAVASYRRAAALAPDDTDALNKLAVVERALGRAGLAESLLRKAIELAPHHPYARVNLATLVLENGREAEGIAALREIASQAGLPPDARAEVEDALAMHAEQAALAAPLAAALAEGSPAPLAVALRAGHSQIGRDDALLADLDALADRLATMPPVDARFARGRPVSSTWPALEAHHNMHLPLSDGALARSVALVAGRVSPAGPDDLDVLRYAEAVASRDRDDWPLDDAASCLAWMMWRHAGIAGHRPGLAPGRLKLINNLVTTAPQITRTPPRRIAGTLDVVLGRQAPRVPDDARRAAFLYVAIGEMHPFRDGNGRVMRLLLNRQLAARGLFPHLRRSGSDGELVRNAREHGDALPLVDWLANGSRYAADLDRRWASRQSVEGSTP